LNLKDDTSDAVVGWAIVNTTGSGNLQVQVHTNSAAPGTWDVYVRIAGLNAPGPAIPDGPITVDAEGEGNAHFVIDISSLFGPTPPESIGVRVVVKGGDDDPRYITSPGGKFTNVPVK